MSDDCRPARVVPVQGPDRLFGVLHLNPSESVASGNVQRSDSFVRRNLRRRPTDADHALGVVAQSPRGSAGEQVDRRRT
jgi:hypothetical protein